VQLHLVDINASLVAAWNVAFRAFPEVSIEQADILMVAKNTIVSPANSLGFMDGGIDAAYLAFFGPKIQSTVQDAIGRRPDGQLPVGASIIVRTGHGRIPFMVVAPTMTMPEAVSADHAYRALRAVLRIAGNDPEVGKDIYCPGLATLTGRVPAEAAAHEMAEAYRDWKNLG
jgi:O-acetyl-ADP-ribose deacetylase (regulator of RNase III)